MLDNDRSLTSRKKKKFFMGYFKIHKIKNKTESISKSQA